MRALTKAVVDVIWAAVEPLLPVVRDSHPLGCHRPRASDRLCLQGIIWRLVLGCSWTSVEILLDCAVSDTTLRRRRDEWVAAGVFDRIAAEALAAWDRVMGLRLAEVCIDGSIHKAPCGGAGTGKSPVDRRKSGWKWSIATDAAGIVVGWAADGANRNDIMLLGPTVDQITERGLHHDIDTLHLDRGLLGRPRRRHRVGGRHHRPDAAPQTQTPRRRPRRSRTGTAGAALDRGAHQLVAVQLRAAPPQHRPPPPAPPSPARPRHHAHHHRQTHRPPQPLATPMTHPSAHALSVQLRVDWGVDLRCGSRGNLWCVDDETDDTPSAVVMSAHEAALVRHPELVAQMAADQADPSRAVRSEARRSRGGSGT